MNKPFIILIRPQMGENIGAAARAMANFSLKEMRLVAPRDGWPNVKAADTAAKALPILDDAQLFDSVRESVADCHFVLATTARIRDDNKPGLDVRDAMQEARARIARGEKVAILFGPERTGLENEDIALADALLHIPVDPDYSSLNLAQAVVVVAHEWFSAAPAKPAENLDNQASKEELAGLFDQIERELDAANFWRVPEKKESVWRHVRSSLSRAQFTGPEVATWRGVIRAISRNYQS
jgi:tRNA/rRNA methyltransferase